MRKTDEEEEEAITVEYFRIGFTHTVISVRLMKQSEIIKKRKPHKTDVTVMSKLTLSYVFSKTFSLLEK